MMQNRFKIALRNLWKNKRSSLINIFGLSVGLACSYLIILYSWHEYTYDTFHPKADRIFRVEYGLQLSNEVSTGRTPPTVGPRLVDYFPEIEAAARFYPRELSVEVPESGRQFELDNVFFADSSALRVFDFDFIRGDRVQALHSPSSVILTAETALRLYGSMEVIGRPLRLAGEDGFSVSGVVKAWPDNAHMEFNMLLTYGAMVAVEPAHARAVTQWVIDNNWIATHSFTYVLLRENQDPSRVNRRFAQFIDEFGDERFKEKQSLSLLPVKDIHLYSEEGGPKPPGNLNYLYLFAIVGIIILMIAAINFINLSTASSFSRAKEVGVRKVLGAQRISLVGQFLGESFLLSFLAFLIAMALTVWALPYLNELTGLEITYAPWHMPKMTYLFVGIFLLTGFLAGIYPAFFVTRFKPLTVLRGTLSENRSSGVQWFRKSLITLQFVAAIGFIAGTITVYLQLRYLQNQPLGFNRDLVINLPLNSGGNINEVFRPGDSTLRQRMNTFDESLSEHPNVIAVTQGYRPPGLGAVGRNVWNDHIPQSENLFARVLSVDYDYVESFDLKIVEGRDFDRSFGTDHLSSFMINEEAVQALGWSNPSEAVGQSMVLEGKEGQVIGVLKNFNYASLYQEIDPLVLEVRPGAFAYFSVVIEDANITATLSFLEDKWKQFFPEKVFEFEFLDDRINEAYLSERRLSEMIGYFSLVAIFIACFGLLGLAALLIQQRFREIGIRKVLGASVNQILRLISEDFMKLIGLAMLIAAPLTWYALSGWLEEFAYRIEFPWWLLLVSGLIVILIAFVAICTQSLRAALANPVDAIRDE